MLLMFLAIEGIEGSQSMSDEGGKSCM